MTIKRLCVSILILLGFVGFSTGQNPDRSLSEHLSDSILNARGEVFFTFPLENLSSQLEKYLSIHTIKQSTVYAYANKKGFHKFLDSNIEFKLQPENFQYTRLKKAAIANPDSVYPSYSQYLEIMQNYAKGHGLYCELYQAGLSAQGRKLLMLRISSPLSSSGIRPAVLLSSSIHGNELTGYKLLLWLSEYLLNNYQKDGLVTRLMDETEIWINPLANPDGTYFGGNNTVSQATRFNANALDLNRNYPDPAEGQHPDDNSWQPETMVMMDFLKEKKIVLSASLHTGEEVVNYPWDTWPRLHADNDWYMQIAGNYTSLAHGKSSTYMDGFNNGIVNGYLWYRITGGRQDYVNYFLHSRELTIELSSDDMPDSVTITKLWEYNREPLLKYLEGSLYGIRGRITEAETGLPLKAKVELIDHDKDNSWVYSDSLNGRYYRLLAPGTYTIQVSTAGYAKVSRQFTLKANEMSEFDFELEPISDDVLVFPNPFHQSITLLLNKELLPSRIKISFTDVTGKVVFVRNQPVTEEEVRISVPLLSDGLYILKLESPNFVKQVKMMKLD